MKEINMTLFWYLCLIKCYHMSLSKSAMEKGKYLVIAKNSKYLVETKKMTQKG